MERIKDEAIRAKSIAEEMLEEGDFVGAKKFAEHAQSLYPQLEGLSQLLTILDMYVSIENKIGGEVDSAGQSVTFMANKANMAGKQLHQDHDVSCGTAMSYELVPGYRRVADRITRDTMIAGSSSEYDVDAMTLSPYIGSESGELLDGGISGRSTGSPVVMGVGRSDPTLNMKGQSKGEDNGISGFLVPPGLILEPMSPYLEGVTGLMEDAHDGQSVNHSLVGDFEGSDLPISSNAQSMAMGSGSAQLGVHIGEILQQLISPYPGGVSVSLMDGMLSRHHVEQPMEMCVGGSRIAVSTKGQGVGVRVGKLELPITPNTSSSLFARGLPANCTRREVSHIFRPFIGYKEVKLVTLKRKNPGADPLVACFVDFVSPEHAAAAKDALQGYVFDELDSDSARLELEFVSEPGAGLGEVHQEKH